MLKGSFKGKSLFKRVFKFVRWQKFRADRRLSDHRATSMAIWLTITGALTPPRAISSVARSK
jgi:hypothetical protein